MVVGARGLTGGRRLLVWKASVFDKGRVAHAPSGRPLEGACSPEFQRR
jgi:hypothetical protein